MSHFAWTQRLHPVVAGGATAILLALAAVTMIWPHSVETLTGVRASPELAPPDELPPLSQEDAAPFFQSRNQLTIHVNEATTLRQFLDRNRLNKPFQRRQIVEQLGSGAPDAQIAAGTTFELRLTPVAEDVPGTVSTRKATAAK